MWVMPVSMPRQEVHVHADRRLAYEVLTAFGVGKPGEETSKVLKEEEGRLLVEFHTSGKGLFGRPKVYDTLEWVSGHEPERVDFDTVEGPLTMMQDHITPEEQGGCTLLRYESECGLWGWLAGWAMMMLYVRPVKQRFVRAHLDELKETIEARAKRSRVYPQQPCEMETAGSSHGA